MSVLIIGGNGLFGRKVVNRLLQDTEVSSVVSMDLTPPKETFMSSIRTYTDKFHFVCGDVSQLEDILTVMKSFSIKKVINFAYLLDSITQNIPRATTKINLVGMCNVFEAARLLDVSRVVYASSIGVYGPQAEYGDREVTEEDHLHPSNTYGVTKQLNEILAAQYSEQYDMSIIGLRPSVGFGHGGKAPDSVKRFSSIVSLPAVGKPAFIEAQGSSTCSLICVDDLAELTRILLHAPSPRYRIYNVAGPPVNFEQVANQVRQYIPGAKIEFGQEPQVTALPWKVSSIRAKDEFGFSIRPLEEAVLMHINDARKESGLKPIET